MKKLWQKYASLVIAVPIAAAFIVITVFFSRLLALCEAAMLVLLCILYVLYENYKSRHIVRRVKSVSKQLDIKEGSTLEKIPFLVAAFDENGDVFWFNDSFSNDFLPDGKSSTGKITEILSINELKDVFFAKRVTNPFSDKTYSAYCREYLSDSEKKEYILYLFNDTELKKIEKKYYATRLSVVLVRVDNADEIYQNFKESECGAIFGRIEEIVNTWAQKHSSICRKFSASRYLILAEEQNLTGMIEDKFKILEYVRNLSYADKKINATLSIGIGKGEELPAADEAAKEALEMAQSRGGDQTAIKNGTEYTFFGGVSGGFERSNKIKARQIASSLSQLIKSCENVMIMGHRYADLDSFGSALGIAAIAKAFNKPVNIAVNKETALAKPLIKKVEDAGDASLIVSPDKAIYMVTEKTVLVVVDTHRTDFAECPELLEMTKNIVIIDHHRKCVDCIENPVILFLSSAASSAAEMITELCQYIGTQPVVDKITAQGLLSGIALDTRNFVLRTGVRTFEAAAYLKSKGADTVEVKKLFSNDAEINKYRNKIVDDSFSYKDCAISVTSADSSNIRLITSQAADELLNLEGVKAAFVIFSVADMTCISARSFGEMNVQVVMEKFGGGGHATMAAAQVTGESKEAVLEKLKEEIDSYYESI